VPRSLVWSHLRPLAFAARRSTLRDGELYWVASGSERGLVFVYRSGHRRELPSEEAYLHHFQDRPIRPIRPGLARALPRGSPVPDVGGMGLVEALASSSSTDEIREALCADLSGSGYEIGAGDRPTRVPAACQVEYVDRFTFEEAADGSFIGKDPRAFVRVSIFETIERLDSIPDGSADFFIVCHVLEHVSDVIGALAELHRKLRPGGRAVLVVPDGRYTFDAERPVTTLEHLLADHLERGRGELEHYLEHFRRAAREQDWVAVAREGYARGRDIHRHVFTPESMRELLGYLADEVAFAAVDVLEPRRAEELREFYVKLRR
jgi:SAM-dependent methyltransferase